ncbi:MAG: YceI family protein [Leptospira sp.]|nr:YceI family protein [Leptospira sp.]
MKFLFLKICLLVFILFHMPLFADESCKYSFDPKGTTIEWTAFKFTERTGVKGTFDHFTVTKTKKADSILGTVQGLSFIIKTNSVNSNNPDRDEKIKKYFFGSLKNSPLIKGSFSKISGTNSGDATLHLELGKTKQSLPVKFSINADTIEMNGSLDINILGLGNGLQKLNEICNDLHKGKDGQSKLWPDVEFKVISKLNKKCKN